MDVSIHKDPATWDSFVETSPDAWNYHRWIWKEVIQETYGHEPIYLSASRNGVIDGILPLFFISSRLFGRFLISIPFFSYCGVVARTTEAKNALLSSAVEHAEELGAKYIEIRQATDCETGWEDVPSKVRMQRVLPANPDKLMGELDSNLRYRIRRARQQGFRIQWGGIESVKDFYPIFAANMRNLGTPVYPKEWFLNICRRAPEQVKILTTWHGTQAVAAAFLIPFRDTLELPWNASLSHDRGRFAGVWLHWSMLEGAAQNGYRCLDLGRSTPGSGSHRFKKPWANREVPLHWPRWLPPGVQPPQLTRESPRYRLAVRMWQHLPIPVANQLGPLIVRSIP
jgi:FemAB-related protein (PEP-CTERM system-associated)